MKRILFPALILLVFASVLKGQPGNPDEAQFVTTDIDNFWNAFDRAFPRLEADTFAIYYLRRGSDGVRGFVPGRIVGAKELASTVRRAAGYYQAARPSMLRIQEMKPGVYTVFRALKDLYPEAVFPNVYFVVGRLNSGGTSNGRGLIIGAEMYGLVPESPLDSLTPWQQSVVKPVELIPHIVAHELIHYQQKYPGNPGTLLSQSIMEGSADFLAELISGRHINDLAHDYAKTRQAELWAEFSQRMNGKDFTGWLYGGDQNKDRPADLGYWMGYQICKAYYERTEDKKQAIRDILNIKDFPAFLEASGYGK